MNDLHGLVQEFTENIRLLQHSCALEDQAIHTAHQRQRALQQAIAVTVHECQTREVST